MWARQAFRSAALLSVLAACGNGSTDARDSTSTTMLTVTESGPVAATELVVGDCLGQVALGARERAKIDSARVVSCEQRHALEVFASFALDPAAFETDPPGSYPGQQRVVDAADQGCVDQLEQVADPATFGLIALWPTEESWQVGDRTVVCAAFPTDGTPFEGRQLIAEL